MNLKLAATALGFSLSTLFIGGCGQQTEADLIAEAQLCLDKSTSATAQKCAAMLAGITSAQSYSIRCSADFIEQGFDSADKLADAMNTLKSGGAGAAPTGMLSVLAFTTKLSNVTTNSKAAYADQTFDFCQKSEQKGLSMVAMMARTATQLTGIAADAGIANIDFSNPASITPAALDTVLTSMTEALPPESDPTYPAKLEQQTAAKEAVGTSVQVAYSSTCETGAQANQEVCGQISAAATARGIDVNSATPAQIGAAVLDYWKSLH